MERRRPAPTPPPTGPIGAGGEGLGATPPAETVLLEKLRRPEAVGLARDRLEAPLSAADSPRTTLVIAPAGSGKTTLLTRVAATHAIASAWYRVGPEDMTEEVLVRHLERALILAPDGLEPGGRAGSVDELISMVQCRGDAPVHLVVDDLHEVAGTAAERSLERFLQLRPRSIRVSLGSRRPPVFNTSRMLASGSLIELGGEDLRFRSWEVEELFRRVYRQPLSPEAAAALTRRTGGWAAGLQLFHLATRGKSQSDREAAVTRLGGRSRLIRTYLTRNVLDELSPDRRVFLLRTCTLGTLTGGLCDELLETTGSAAVLAELERQQFFTISTDDGLSYRYHQVLSSHLEALLLDEIGSVEASRWYRRSAAVLERAGRIREAMRAFARAQDWPSVARMVRQSNALLSVEDDLLGPALSHAPGWRDDPWLVLANARRLLRCGAVGASVQAFREAEDLLDAPEHRRRCRQERAMAALWLGEAITARDLQVASVGQVATILAGVRAATVRATPDAVFGDGPVADLGIGVVRLLAGDFAAARSPLSRAVAAAEPGSCERLCAELGCMLADFEDGDAGELAKQLDELATTAEAEGHPWVARVARGAQSSVLLAASAGSREMTRCSEAVDTSRRLGDHWGELVMVLCQGVALALTGAAATALPRLSEATRIARSLHAPVLALWADALTSAVSASSGRIDPPGSAVLLQRTAHELGVPMVPQVAGALLAAGRHDGPADRSAQERTSPTHTPAVEVRCLGGFRLVRETVAVDVGTLRPRARALLLLLAIQHGRDVHRERLIDLLWPDASLTAGTRRLQVAVSSVRGLLAAAQLGDVALERHADAYRLVVPGARFDLDAFAGLAHRSGELRALGDGAGAIRVGLEALATYSGDLLPEVGPAEWVVAERDRLRLMAAETAGDVGRLCLELGRPAQGLPAARRAVELDPLRDTAWLTLAELQERCGDHSAAAATRREHLRVTTELQVTADAWTAPTVSSGGRPPAPGAARGQG